jgi:hypothetical protein
LRRVVIGVMTGAVALLMVAGLCGAIRASQAEEEAARYNAPPSAAVGHVSGEAVVATPAEVQETHGGGPPTSPNAARFPRPKSIPSPRKSHNASALPR